MGVAVTRRWLRYARGWYEVAEAVLSVARHAWRTRHDVVWDDEDDD